MIANVTSFFKPQTQAQMYGRIAGVLIGCIAILFTVLLVNAYRQASGSVYFSDGQTVLKLSPNNMVTIYKVIK